MLSLAAVNQAAAPGGAGPARQTQEAQEARAVACLQDALRMAAAGDGGRAEARAARAGGFDGVWEWEGG